MTWRTIIARGGRGGGGGGMAMIAGAVPAGIGVQTWMPATGRGIGTTRGKDPLAAAGRPLGGKADTTGREEEGREAGEKGRAAPAWMRAGPGASQEAKTCWRYANPRAESAE